MRQRCWLELINDYDLKILYQEGKANKVANTLSRKSAHLLNVLISANELCEEIKRLSLEIVKPGYVKARCEDIFEEIRCG